jgi:hypothetical protein
LLDIIIFEDIIIFLYKKMPVTPSPSIKPIFVCNGKCMYCIHKKCIEF